MYRYIHIDIDIADLSDPHLSMPIYLHLPEILADIDRQTQTDVGTNIDIDIDIDIDI
jgi:hypothetical protein